MTFASIIIQLLNGLAAAASLFLVSAGLSLIFGVMRLVNIAHGDLIVLAAYVALMVTQGFGIDPLSALLLVLYARRRQRTEVLLGTALLHVLPEAFESKVEPHRLFATLLGGLLFFFLLAATLANPNVIKLTLPKADTNTSAKQTVVVSIDAQKNFYVATKLTPFEGLEDAVKSYLGNQTDPAIVINADKTVPIEEVVKVMNIAKILKVKVVLATKPLDK